MLIKLELRGKLINLETFYGFSKYFKYVFRQMKWSRYKKIKTIFIIKK